MLRSKRKAKNYTSFRHHNNTSDSNTSFIMFIPIPYCTPHVFLLLNITTAPPSPSPSPPRPQNLPPVQALDLFRLIVHQIPAPCSRSPITPRAQARARPRRERWSLVAIDQIANGFPVRHGTSWRRGLWLCFLHLRRWVITVLCLWRWS